MLFIGDVHGKYRQYRELIRDRKDTIQVGDMGVGFFKGNPIDFYEKVAMANPPYDAMVEGNHRFIRGNHDNPAVCKKHSQWIADGTVTNDMMFVGGGVSIDKDWRVEGMNWWPDEELDYGELQRIIDIYSVVKPRIMVTHDCPEWLPPVMGYRLFKMEYPSRTRQAFESMHALHQPEIWVFGHWHGSYDNVERGTRFVCLAELEAKDIE